MEQSFFTLPSLRLMTWSALQGLDPKRFVYAAMVKVVAPPMEGEKKRLCRSRESIARRGMRGRPRRGASWPWGLSSNA